MDKKHQAQTGQGQSPDWFYPLVWESVEAQYSISADAKAARAIRERAGAPPRPVKGGKKSSAARRKAG